MSDLTPKDVKENEFVYYKDHVTQQELKFLVVDVEDEIFSNGFTCRLMLLDEPQRIVKILNHQDSSAFSVARQVRQVADDAYKYRDAFDEWPNPDVILLSRCYTKQYGEVIEAVKKSLASEKATEDLRALDGYELYHGDNINQGSHEALEAVKELIKEYDNTFLHASKARNLAENALNTKERVNARIVEAARSGEFETYLTAEEFKICELDLVEQGYVVLNNKIFWDEGI